MYICIKLKFDWFCKDDHKDSNGEFSQIGNVDVGVKVDVESHPVGHHTPQILWLVSCFKNIFALIINFKGKYQDKLTANISGKEKNRHLLLWTSFFCGVVDPTG